MVHSELKLGMHDYFSTHLSLVGLQIELYSSYFFVVINSASIQALLYV